MLVLGPTRCGCHVTGSLRASSIGRGSSQLGTATPKARGEKAPGCDATVRRSIQNGMLADPTGFEPAISSVTGWHVGPLHHGSAEGQDSRRARGCQSIGRAG